MPILTSKVNKGVKTYLAMKADFFAFKAFDSPSFILIEVVGWTRPEKCSLLIRNQLDYCQSTARKYYCKVFLNGKSKRTLRLQFVMYENVCMCVCVGGLGGSNGITPGHCEIVRLHLNLQQRCQREFQDNYRRWTGQGGERRQFYGHTTLSKKWVGGSECAQPSIDCISMLLTLLSPDFLFLSSHASIDFHAKRKHPKIHHAPWQ